MQELIGFVAPFFHFIITLFGASTAGSIPFILSSCLFLTGLLWKNNNNLVPPKHVKEGVQTHVTDLASQAKLGPDMSVPAHVGRLQQEADFSPQSPLKTDVKSNGTVYKRRRPPAKREHLPATYQRHAELLFEALENPDHELRQAAEQGLRGFAEAAVKNKGMSVNSAAEEFDVPAHFLLRWAKQMGVIPILLEGKGPGSPTYIEREKAQEVAAIYHEAKRLGIQPIKLLERRKTL